MKTILDTIIAHKRKEVHDLRKEFTYADFEKFPLFDKETTSLTETIKRQPFGIIAELKRKSPSAGIINDELDIEDQACEYESAGVTGISCLTDKTFFGGSTQDLALLSESTSVPILRKEFIIDEIQLFEAKANGADAVLLIAEVLEVDQALSLTLIAQQLGMEVIMECHDFANLQKINDQVDIIGVNNRNLHLQKTDITTSKELYPFLPDNKALISESGIKTRSEILELAAIGYHGALIGESILKQTNPKEFIASLTPQNTLSCS